MFYRRCNTHLFLAMFRVSPVTLSCPAFMYTHTRNLIKGRLRWRGTKSCVITSISSSKEYTVQQTDSVAELAPTAHEARRSVIINNCCRIMLLSGSLYSKQQSQTKIARIIISTKSNTISYRSYHSIPDKPQIIAL